MLLSFTKNPLVKTMRPSFSNFKMKRMLDLDYVSGFFLLLAIKPRALYELGHMLYHGATL